jgi:ABC-type cobalamin/Fe3+-siderophores transport system ATPase subunit
VKKIAICVFGVNGAGKSSLLQVVSDMRSDAVVVRGSVILKEALGVASYEALE